MENMSFTHPNAGWTSSSNCIATVAHAQPLPPLSHPTSYNPAFTYWYPSSEQPNCLKPSIHPSASSTASLGAHSSTLSHALHYELHDGALSRSFPGSSTVLGHQSPPSPVPSSSSSYAASPPTPYDIQATGYFDMSAATQMPMYTLPTHTSAPALSPTSRLAPFTLNANLSAAQLRRARTSRSELFVMLPGSEAPPEREADAVLPSRPATAPATHVRHSSADRPASSSTVPQTPQRAVKTEPIGDEDVPVLPPCEAPPSAVPSPVVPSCVSPPRIAPPCFVPTCVEDLEGPPVPSDVPLRATGAPPGMRRMMGAFRLDPFALHDGVHAAFRPGLGGTMRVGEASVVDERELCWNGEEVGPLKGASALVEFQVALDDPDILLPNQIKYPHLFPPSKPSPPSSPEVPSRRKRKPAPTSPPGLYTLDSDPEIGSTTVAPWMLAGNLASSYSHMNVVYDAAYMPTQQQQQSVPEMMYAYVHAGRSDVYIQ